MSIVIKNLTHVYNEKTIYETKAIDDLSLEIKEGDFVGIIGHTGSGKSTLIQHLNGIMKPTSGEILYQGENIFKNKESLVKLRQKIGLVFQYPEHQLFEVTVYKDVAFGPVNMGLSPIEIQERVEWALNVVDLHEDVYEKSPFELSGGQKRRVAIAGILAMKPEVLILDEPTAGLDPEGRNNLLSQLQKFHQNMGMTIILVSHSMEDIAKLVQTIIVMDKGKIKYSGTSEEVFKNIEGLEKIGLRAPQITYLFSELRKKGYQVSDNIYTVEAAAKELSKLIKQVKK